MSVSTRFNFARHQRMMTSRFMYLNVPDTEASLEKRSEAVTNEVGQLFFKEDAVLGRRLGHKFPGEPTFFDFLKKF